MTILKKNYTIIHSWNEEISGLMYPCILLALVFFLLAPKVALVFSVLGMIGMYSHFKGYGKVILEERSDGYWLVTTGKHPMEKKVKDISFGWSYRISPVVSWNSSLSIWDTNPMDSWRSDSSSQRGSNSLSNTIVLNAILEVEGSHNIIIHQELMPWQELPKGWKYVGHGLSCERCFLKIYGGLKKIKKHWRGK